MFYRTPDGGQVQNLVTTTLFCYCLSVQTDFSRGDCLSVRKIEGTLNDTTLIVHFLYYTQQRTPATCCDIAGREDERPPEQF
jgi:hypothetical protein